MRIDGLGYEKSIDVFGKFGHMVCVLNKVIIL